MRCLSLSPSPSLSLSISPAISLSLPVFCCFEVLCALHTQTAFLPRAKCWPGPDSGRPNAEMLLITAECGVCQSDHRFPSLFMSNYTISRLLLSLPTPSDCRIVRQMYFHTRMPPSPTGQKNNQEHLAFVFQCESAFIPGSNGSAVVRDLSASAPTGSDGNTTPRWLRLRLSPTFSPTRCCDAR